jgi:hypothetical protein
LVGFGLVPSKRDDYFAPHRTDAWTPAPASVGLHDDQEPVIAPATLPDRQACHA